MLKTILFIMLSSSLLFALSYKEQQKYIKQINDHFIANGNTNRIYKFDIDYKTKTFLYAYEVEFTTAGNKQDIINNFCSGRETRKAINKGWTYKMSYRNKYSKKIILNLVIDKYDCR